jgi:hypothetical protein
MRTFATIGATTLTTSTAIVSINDNNIFIGLTPLTPLIILQRAVLLGGTQ